MIIYIFDKAVQKTNIAFVMWKLILNSGIYLI